MAHFSMRYALIYEQPQFPVLGLSVWGACLLWGSAGSILFSLVAGGVIAPLFGAVLGSLAPLFVLVVFAYVFAGILYLGGFGRETYRPTPAQRWDAKEEER